MSTVTFSVGEDNTTCSTFYNWAHRISTAMATFGWVQTGDTGQVVWPVSIVNISAVSWNGATATYTYTLLQGPGLVSGQTIIITGCTTAAMNGTFVITGLPLSTTFTTANATAASSESETANHAFGGVNPQIAISNAIGNGSTNTYTYTNTYGTLRTGMSVVITGCTTSGFNGTFIVASINSGAGTFTTTTGISHASEVETGTGLITSNTCATTIATATTTASSLPPSVGGGNVVFETWTMADALNSTFPIIIRIGYMTNNAAAANPALQVASGTTTDGAGNLTGNAIIGPTNILGFTATTLNTSTAPSYLSGSTNRLTMALWPSTPAHIGFYSIERSHDSAGNDTASYATVTIITGGASAVVPVQTSFTPTAVTTGEVKIPCITKTGTGSGSFGTSTLLSPAFPIVGAIGNPLTNVLVGKSVDWSDQVQFSFTMYNTTRGYITSNSTAVNAAGVISYDTTATCALAYRYD